jgi:hypothetical protein
MAACLPDRRQAGKVEHRLVELLRQRIHGLACGYPDANDAARLEADPIHKLLVGRDPFSGRDLASQPSLSRFENAAGPQALYRMGVELASRVIERHGKRLGGHARRVTIDLDPTDDATHGAQQLSFFPCAYMPSPLPRQEQQNLIARNVLSPSAFPEIQAGRLLHHLLRGLLSVHSRYGLYARQVAQGDPLHRRLRRFRYLHRRSDCYRVERTSSRAGLSPAVDQRLFTAH